MSSSHFKSISMFSLCNKTNQFHDIPDAGAKCSPPTPSAFTGTKTRVISSVASTRIPHNTASTAMYVDQRKSRARLLGWRSTTNPTGTAASAATGWHQCWGAYTLENKAWNPKKGRFGRWCSISNVVIFCFHVKILGVYLVSMFPCWLDCL